MSEFFSNSSLRVSNEHSYTLFLVTPSTSLFPFFTFTFSPQRGTLEQAYVWNKGVTVNVLQYNSITESFISWCTGLQEEPHFVICLPNHILSLLYGKQVTWSSSIKMIQSDIKQMTKEVPQVCKIHSFLFLLDLLPCTQTRSLKRKPEPSSSLSENVTNGLIPQFKRMRF